MKKYNANISKLIIVLLAVFFFNCENEEDNTLVDEHENIGLTKIDFTTFIAKVGHNPNFSKIVNNLDYNYKYDSSNQAKNKSWKDSEIITNSVIYYNGKETTTYTLQVVNDSFRGTINNLVIDTDKDGNIINSHIIQYIPSVEYLEDQSQPFKGYFQLAATNPFGLKNINELAANGGDDCIVAYELIWECAVGNDHAPDDATCQQDRSQTRVVGVNITYGPCPETIDTDGSGTNGGTTGTGGNPSGPSGGPIGFGPTGGPTGNGGNGGSGTGPTSEPCSDGTGLANSTTCLDRAEGVLEALKAEGVIESIENAEVGEDAVKYDTVEDFLKDIQNWDTREDDAEWDKIELSGNRTNLRVKVPYGLGLSYVFIQIIAKSKDKNNGNFGFEGVTSDIEGFFTGGQSWEQDNNATQLWVSENPSIDKGYVIIEAIFAYEIKIGAGPGSIGGKLVKRRKEIIITFKPSNLDFRNYNVKN